jgi:hypothetical protein
MGWSTAVGPQTPTTGCPTTHNSPAGDRLPGGSACRSPPGTRLASAAPRGRRQSRGVAGEWRRGSLQSRSVVTKTCARRGRCCKRPSIGPEDPVVTALTESGSATDSVTRSRSVAGLGDRSGRPLELAEIPARLVSVPQAASGAPLCDPSVRSRRGAAAACSAVGCRARCSRRRRSGSGPASWADRRCSRRRIAPQRASWIPGVACGDCGRLRPPVRPRRRRRRWPGRPRRPIASRAAKR